MQFRHQRSPLICFHELVWTQCTIFICKRASGHQAHRPIQKPCEPRSGEESEQLAHLVNKPPLIKVFWDTIYI
jgi:hypothetical protein